MRLLIKSGVLFLGAIVSFGAETQLPPLAEAGYRVVKTCDYRSARAARADWEPMKGSASVGVARAGRRSVVEMRCNFMGTTIDRASWDTDVKFDASKCQGLRLRFSCADTSPVAQFSFYLRSGKGWYSATLAATETPGWTTVTIDKAGARVEGKPAGWSRIDGIRISAWRGSSADTSFSIADIGVFGENAQVAVIRADSVGRTESSKAIAVRRYTRNVTQYLAALDIAHRVVSDTDLEAYALDGMKIVVLPYNPTMPDRAQSEVIRFVRNVGEMLCFFMLPERVLEAGGMAVGKHMKQEVKGQLASMQFVDGVLPGMPAAISSSRGASAKQGPWKGRTG